MSLDKNLHKCFDMWSKINGNQTKLIIQHKSNKINEKNKKHDDSCSLRDISIHFEIVLHKDTWELQEINLKIVLQKQTLISTIFLNLFSSQKTQCTQIFFKPKILPCLPQHNTLSWLLNLKAYSTPSIWINLSFEFLFIWVK